MEGFFTAKEVQSKSRPDGKRYSCVVCGLYKDAVSPRLQPSGNFKKGILNIGNASSEIEDKIGTHWKGKAGKFLQKAYTKLGIDLFEDCLNVNACHCRSVDSNGNDRDPTTFEIECCRKTTLRVIEEYKPKVVILLGDAALFSVIGSRWKKDLDNIHKWRGWTIPDQDFKTWICPVFHPDEVLTSEGGVEETIWMQDLDVAFKMLEKPLYIFKEPKIEIIDELSVLDDLCNLESAFDYETTGLKPYGLGHRIVCCALTTSEDHAYAFMMPKSKIARQPFVDWLARRSIMKIAQNMKFEEAWSVVRLRQEVVNWHHDTMIFSHIGDNRPRITGLKFQTYVQFGIIDYDSEISPYLKAKEDNGNAINRIDELLALPNGDKKLLKYCGWDAINEFRLYKAQLEFMLPF